MLKQVTREMDPLAAAADFHRQSGICEALFCPIGWGRLEAQSLPNAYPCHKS
jgi:hypothetical protein